MKNYKYRKVTNSNLSTCPLREEKSLSQRAFSIYTDIRKLQDSKRSIGGTLVDLPIFLDN